LGKAYTYLSDDLLQISESCGARFFTSIPP